MQAKPELERAGKDQPLRRIEHFIRRVRRQGLPPAQVTVPQRKLPSGDGVVHDPLEGHVVLVEVAKVEVAPEEEHIGEKENADGQQAQSAQQVGTTVRRHQEPATLKTIGMSTKICIASKMPCAMMPGMRFFVR